MVKGWNEVTIGKYKRICALKEDDDWVWNFLAILDNTTYQDIVTRPINETMALNSEVMKWAKNPPKRHIIRYTYTIDGETYNLRAYPDEITTAQYIDFCNAEKNVPDNLAELLSIFLIPEGHKYNEGYSSADVAKVLEENLNIEDALTMADFFTTLFQLLSGRILRRAKKALKQAKKEGIAPEKTEMAIKLLERYRRISGLK